MLVGQRPISISCFRLVSVLSAVPGLCGASGLTAGLVMACDGSRGGGVVFNRQGGPTSPAHLGREGTAAAAANPTRTVLVV
jgi:hypothetical protein